MLERKVGFRIRNYRGWVFLSLDLDMNLNIWERGVKGREGVLVWFFLKKKMSEGVSDGLF